MELQWPLILFTTLVAWSAGTFSAQAALALAGKAKKSQFALWVTAAVLLIAGGVAVFFHLEHWERIFNGFGHLTSGITQELICIVVLAAVAVAYLVCLRRSGEGTVPKWAAVLAIAASALLVAVMAHSYVMAARPAWSTVLWVVAVLGEACALGPLTMVVIMAVRGDEPMVRANLIALVGTAVNLVTAAAYAVSLQASGNAVSTLGYYFDPTSPTAGLADVGALVADQAPLLWAGAVVVGAVAPLACALIGRAKANTRLGMGVLGVVCTVAGCICLRVVFYALGFSAFVH